MVSVYKMGEVIGQEGKAVWLVYKMGDAIGARARLCT
jgi:hypothetical protein